MAKKNENRVLVTLECEDCKSKNVNLNQNISFAEKNLISVENKSSKKFHS